MRKLERDSSGSMSSWTKLAGSDRILARPQAHNDKNTRCPGPGSRQSREGETR